MIEVISVIIFCAIVFLVIGLAVRLTVKKIEKNLMAIFDPLINNKLDKDSWK